MALPTNLKKEEVPVNIRLLNGATLECCFFAAEGQRLLDLINDKREFIPYANRDGEVTIIQKSTIALITPVNQ